MGNTCFFNATMQCLTHTNALFNFCLTEKTHKKNKLCSSSSESCFLCLTTQYFKAIIKDERTNPELLITRLHKIWSSYDYYKKDT